MTMVPVAIRDHPSRMGGPDECQSLVRVTETPARPDGPEPPGDDQNRQLTRVVGQLGWSVSLYTLRKYGAAGCHFIEVVLAP